MVVGAIHRNEVRGVERTSIDGVRQAMQKILLPQHIVGDGIARGRRQHRHGDQRREHREDRDQ